MFKVGDKVRIRKDSCFHNIDSESNPHNRVVGVIIHVIEDMAEVKWPSSYLNAYELMDLELEYTITKHQFI